MAAGGARPAAGRGTGRLVWRRRRSSQTARFIDTPRVCKHRLFVWMHACTCPDSATIAIARDDDMTFGILHSRFHALQSLKDLEHRIILDAETMGLARRVLHCGPENVKGIEINSYAAELARTTIWIGDIQWKRRNGFEAKEEPVLRPLDAIELIHGRC